MPATGAESQLGQSPVDRIAMAYQLTKSTAAPAADPRSPGISGEQVLTDNPFGRCFLNPGWKFAHQPIVKRFFTQVV